MKNNLANSKEINLEIVNSSIITRTYCTKLLLQICVLISTTITSLYKLQTVIIVLMDLGKQGLQSIVGTIAVEQSKTFADTVHLRTKPNFIYFSGNQQLSPS